MEAVGLTPELRPAHLPPHAQPLNGQLWLRLPERIFAEQTSQLMDPLKAQLWLGSSYAVSRKTVAVQCSSLGDGFWRKDRPKMVRLI